MTKKILLPIIGLTLLFIGLVSWQTGTYSKLVLPYPNFPEDHGTQGPDTCLQSIANEAAIMKNSWNENLQSIMQQPNAPEEKVDPAFESMRTYRCWLDYLCEAVLFSGTADTKQMNDDQSKGVSVGVYLPPLSTCTKATNIVIPGTKLKYMPYCSISKNENTQVANADTYYRQCQSLAQMEFADAGNQDAYFGNSAPGQLPTSMRENLKDQSGAFIGLENALKTNAADQKSRVLQSKLSDIVSKMHGMESHIDLLERYMEEFDQRLPCVAQECT